MIGFYKLMSGLKSLVKPFFSDVAAVIKGQLISKCLFGVFNFLHKMNENKSHSSKIEFFCSLFGGNVGLKNSF